MNKWLALAQMLAPILLSAIKPELAPIAGDITNGIVAAEQMKSAKGTDKLSSVQAIGVAAADALNTAKGKTVVDLSELNDTIAAGVNTTIKVLNIVHPKVATPAA